MLKKLCYLVPIVVLLVVMGTMGTNSARGAALHWTGNASPDPSWHNPLNWDQSVVPQGGDDAYCKKNTGKKDPNFTSNSSTDPLCLLCIADVSADGALNIDGGTLNVVSALRATKGSTGTRTAVVNMKGGTVALYGRGVTVGDCVGSAITDGSFNWGPNAGTENVTSTWNMQGGLITTGTFTVPSGGTISSSVFNLNGGTVIVRETSSGCDNWTLGSGATGFFVNEVVNTDRANAGAHYRRGSNDLGILNITGGTMIVKGNITPLLDPCRYDSTQESYMGLIDPCEVVVPYPSLSDTSYNKYIVYDYSQRNDARTTITAKATPKAQAWKPGGLERTGIAVDCNGTDGTKPIDGALFASTTPTLKWNGGAGASDGHDVYFGTTTNPSYQITVEPGDPCQFTPDTLSLGQTYYWKAVAQPSGQAETWSFTVEGKAKGPDPLDGASKEPNSTRNVLLKWSAGAHSTSHDVYWGTDSTSLSQIGNDLTATSKLQQVTLGQVNYWRVDENSEAAYGPVTTTGTIWSFTVKNYDLVDNFEGYTSPVTTGSSFSSIWKTSGTMPLTLTVSSGRLYKDPVHAGKQGMLVEYNYGSIGTGASNALFTEAQNWSTETAGCGAVALSFWMRGKGNNGTLSNLYIQLATDTATGSAYYSGKVSIDNFSSRILNEEWQNVNIAMADFTTGAGGSFNLNSVKRLFIGSQAGGAVSGDLWIDDIRLYVPRCVDQADRIPRGDTTHTGAPLADITNDCKVNGYDLYRVTDAWLTSDTDVSAAGVLQKCKFDGNSVTGVLGNALKLGQPTDWVDIDDLAFPNFSNKTIAFWVRVDDTPMPSTTKHLIFSTSSNWRLNINADNDAINGLQLDAQAGNQFTEPTVFGVAQINEDSWHHVALTVGAATGGQVDVTMYVDGVLKEYVTVEAHYYNSLFGACIGALKNGVNQHSNITIDDFRIYNVALTDTGSPSDIDKLADTNSGTNPTATPLIKYDFNETTGTVAANTGSMSTVHHPVGYALGSGGEPDPRGGVSLGELYTGTDGGKTYINLKDYAKLASSWLYGTGGSNGDWVYP